MKDGGPAFPAPDFAVKDSIGTDAIMRLKNLQGMTMRQWYKGMALQGMLAAETGDDRLEPDQYAAEAGRMADAMIAEDNHER